MKIVFLDVDGVLNSYRNVIAQGGFPFPKGSHMSDGNPEKHGHRNLDPLAVGMVRRLCKETGAQIVLHSTWRKYVKWEEFGAEWDLPVIGTTDPNAGKNKSVSEWLVEHKPEKFVVIDDDNMAWPGPTSMPEQVFTDILNGFSYENYQKAYDILGAKE